MGLLSDVWNNARNDLIRNIFKKAAGDESSKSGILKNVQNIHKGLFDEYVDRTGFVNDFKNSFIDNGSQKPVGMPDSDWCAMQEAQSESKNESASVDNGSKLSDYDKTLMDKLFKNGSSDVEFTESSAGDMEFGD